MNIFNKNEIKYKLLTKEELLINLDRLSRFKLPEYSYNSVFSSIIFKSLITPNFSKKDIEDLDVSYISQIVKEIWNNSVKKHFGELKDNNIALKAHQLTIFHTFKDIDIKTKKLINTDLYFSQILEHINYNTAPQNLKYLIKINSELKNKENININDLKELRNKFSLGFPVEKLLIAEGITEEILLPVFADKLGNNFNKKGIYIVGAGGKSKSPSLYLEIKNKLNIPIVLLFDLDAKEICNILEDILQKKDKYILIEKGEFEDILSINLIKRTLNNEYEPATPLSVEDLKIHEKMCENIEEFYRTRHLGEYKKSKVAKLLSENIKYPTDISEDIKEILSKII